MSKKKQAKAQKEQKAQKKLLKWEAIMDAMGEAEAEAEACNDPDCDCANEGGFIIDGSSAGNAEMRRQFALNAAMMALGGGPWGGARLDAATFLSTAAQIENYLKEGMKTAPTVPWDDRVK
jgi:hypothetical protein